ncbi:MAG: hypothetical protein JJ919_17325 [Henriciella sp.]|nr:hypothetical protein [Henriciella sp.]
MKKLIFALGALSLAACSGSGTLTSPVDANAVRSAVQSTLGLECDPVNPDPGIGMNCGRRLAYMTTRTEDDGSQSMVWLEIKHAANDREQVLKLLDRFGFSEDDFLAVVERGQRLTRGDFTLDAIGREKILVFEK